MADLCVLADVKAYLGLTSSTDDAVLSTLISAESAFIQSYLDRVLQISPYTDQFSGTGRNRHHLYNYPCTAVTSVTVNGTAIPLTTSPTVAGYMMIDDSVVLIGGYQYSRGDWNCIISYTAGIATPLDIAHACIELVAMRYRERDRIAISSKGLAGETTSYVTKSMPDHVKDILKPYKKVIPI